MNSIFLFVIFLWTIWEFHIMILDQTHTIVLQSLPCHPVISLEEDEKGEDEEQRKKKTTPICVAHVLTGPWSTPSCQSLKEN